MAHSAADSAHRPLRRFIVATEKDDPAVAPHEVVVETAWYRIRFGLLESGSAVSMIYKPLDLDLRAEDYYTRRNNLFRDWVRLAEPDPETGLTPHGCGADAETHLPARWRVLERTDEALVLEFETRCGEAGGPPWMRHILNRRRIALRYDTPAVRVENQIVNEDGTSHPILFEVCNGLSLGRVDTCVAMPGPEGKITGLDYAEERFSRALFCPEPAGDWTGGLNEHGVGAGFSFDWADVDAMSATLHKTVGASYTVSMRRRDVPPRGSVAFAYTFMPFAGMGAFDGIRDDLAGGVLVGEKATYLHDVADDLLPGAAAPVRVFLCSGRDRTVEVRAQAVRLEDGRLVLDERRTCDVRTAEARTLDFALPLPDEGLYVITVTAADADAGATLTLEKPVRVGRSVLAFEAAPPAGEKRGVRDAGEALGPGPMDPQFTTIDRAHVTPHLPLLKGHIAGPVRAFFLMPADATLGHIRELAQRSDLEYDYFAMGKMMAPTDTFNPRDLRAADRRLATLDADVLVTFGVDWTAGLGRKRIERLLGRVRDGMGAVIAVRDLAKQPELALALAAGRELATDVVRPASATPPAEARCWELGKGRIVVVLCDWETRVDAGEAVLGRWTALRIGDETVHVPELRWRGFEYAYAALAQWLRWAARREGALNVVGASLEGRNVRVALHNGAQEVEGDLRVAVRSRRWEAGPAGAVRVKVSPGESRHVLALDRPAEGGPLALEISLRDVEGHLLAFGSAGARADSGVSLRVVPDPAYQRAAAPGRIAVEISGPQGGFQDTAGGRLVLTVTDRFGRVVLRKQEAVMGSRGPNRFEFALARPGAAVPHFLSAYHDVVAEFFDGDRRLALESADLFLLPDKPPYADAFQLAVAFHPARKALHVQGAVETARRVGITGHTHRPDAQDDAFLYATGGFKTDVIQLSVRRRYAAPDEEVRLDGERLMMHPPLVPSEEAVARTKAEWVARARIAYETGTQVIALEDERRMSGDFDFHPQTLAGFRAWLQARYADVAALNRAWDADFADFGSVMPKRRDEVDPDGNIAPWLEFRIYIGEVLGEYYMKRPAEWAAEVVAEAGGARGLSVSEWGIYEPCFAWPVDWRRYAACYSDTTRYGDEQGILEEVFRCFAPGCNHGQWIGYGMRDIEPGRRTDPWRSLLNGGHFCFFWAMLDNGFWNYAVCTADQRPTKGYAVLAREEFPDLTGGIDRLIIAGRFSDDGIGVAWAYPSWIADESALAKESKLIVEELGFQHQLVSLDDVPSGRLDDMGCRLFIVQQADCISAEQADALQRFVERGGTLLCVGRCGRRDGVGKPHPGGPILDRLTGVDSARAQPLDEQALAESVVGAVHLVVQSANVPPRGDVSVLASAEVKGRRVPLLTRRAVGEGKVFWLNCDLSAHRRVSRTGFAGEDTRSAAGPQELRRSHWALFEHILSEAGLRPRCRLFSDGKPVFGGETWYYASPSGRSLFLARYAKPGVEGPVEVRLAKAGHVYDLRTREYHGFTDTLRLAFPPGRMNVLAVLDYKVEGLSARTSARSNRPGETVTIACRVETDAPPADLHALRVCVVGPDGNDLEAHRTVVPAEGGTATLDIPLALNQPEGEHRVIVSDVVSGKAAEVSFNVQA